jgi:Protein of unknown function (DUF3108)
MPPSPATPKSHRHASLRRLLALTLFVLLVHGLLLGGVPSAVSLLARSTDAGTPPPMVRFATRTIAAAPVPAPAPTPALATPPALAAATPTKGRPAPATPPAATPPSPQATTAAADAAAPASAATPVVPGNNTPSSPTALATPPAPAAPASASAPAPAPSFAPAPAAASATPPPSQAQQASALLFPPPIRLLYDGLGEEKGFIKYAASGELLWLQNGTQYSARLEISAWGFRVRTWTSKGELQESGLAPLRFGDKPRGAELATHFQRDKAIISFSANNPDVPLQPGAQDKLSALLQLSALVAGAPARYGPGSSIRFQAADAHRAEVWEFQVGVLEALELPGGPKQALKLSKAPSVEYDQGIEVWLAPDMNYLPVRLRITEANGAFADLLWRKTQNSE